jgi:hypothetical protein
MIIYGWGKDLKEVAYAGIEKCGQCKNWGHFALCEHSSHASLYFIKVARWNRKFVLVCRTCNNGWQIDESKRESLIRQTISLPSQEHSGLIWNSLDQAASAAFDQKVADGQEVAMAAACVALADTVESLERQFQQDHIRYVAQRYVAFLQDQDKPS